MGFVNSGSFTHEVLVGRCRIKVCRTTELESSVYVQETGTSDVATFL